MQIIPSLEREALLTTRRQTPNFYLYSYALQALTEASKLSASQSSRDVFMTLQNSQEIQKVLNQIGLTFDEELTLLRYLENVQRLSQKSNESEQPNEFPEGRIKYFDDLRTEIQDLMSRIKALDPKAEVILPPGYGPALIRLLYEKRIFFTNDDLQAFSQTLAICRLRLQELETAIGLEKTRQDNFALHLRLEAQTVAELDLKARIAAQRFSQSPLDIPFSELKADEKRFVVAFWLIVFTAMVGGPAVALAHVGAFDDLLRYLRLK